MNPLNETRLFSKEEMTPEEELAIMKDMEESYKELVEEQKKQ